MYVDFTYVKYLAWAIFAVAVLFAILADGVGAVLFAVIVGGLFVVSLLLFDASRRDSSSDAGRNDKK